MGKLPWSTFFSLCSDCCFRRDASLFNCCAQILELNCWCLAAIFLVNLWVCEQAIPRHCRAKIVPEATNARPRPTREHGYEVRKVAVALLLPDPGEDGLMAVMGHEGHSRGRRSSLFLRDPSSNWSEGARIRGTEWSGGSILAGSRRGLVNDGDILGAQGPWRWAAAALLHASCSGERERN